MGSLFPVLEPFDRGFLSVGGGHQLYYQQAGNPEGVPVVYLHGGPGAGCKFSEYRYFDPDRYRVVQFDQRGAGRSTPFASVHNNSISELIDDVERLKTHLGIEERWGVVGGSWGSALAMLYAIRYSDSVARLLLRAVFFADQKGAQHIIEDGGANCSRPEYFDQYMGLIAEGDQVKGLMEPYYNCLVHGSAPLQVEAARRFCIWDMSIATYTVDKVLLEEVKQTPEAFLALARIFFHFAVNEFRKKNREAILSSQDKLARIPIDIVHGEDDLICPLDNAVALHKAYPHSKLHEIPQTGHLMSEPGIEAKFLEIIAEWPPEAD